MEEEEVRFLEMKFTIDEMNLILQALSKEPFKDVFQIIGKINEAAAIQLNDNGETA